MYVVRIGCRMRMTICTTVPQSSMFRRSGIFQTFGCGASFPAFCAAIAASDAGGSLMKKANARKLTKSAPAARKNDMRMPKHSASTPPKSGPTTPPAVSTPCMMPRQRPSFAAGA